jgi:excisionase family DNA binding protein
VGVTIELTLNGARVPVTLDEAALAAIAAALADREAGLTASPPSPYMTIPEAAAYLRCSRQRVDDLLSQRRLCRHKDGSRTLVRREEVERYLGDSP